MESFTFTFKADRTSTTTKELRFTAHCFFGAVTKFYHHVSTHHPDFELKQIKDMYGNEFYAGVLHPEGVAQSEDCVRSRGPA